MAKNDKPIITYIKNDELKVITINKFNEKKYLNEIFDIKAIHGITYYKIKEDISLIRLKNYEFPSNKIKIMPKEIRMGKKLILENCAISNDFNIKRIKDLKIISPKIKESEQVYLPRLNIYSCNKVNIDLNELQEKLNLCCSICVNLNLIGNPNLVRLNLDGIEKGYLYNTNYQSEDIIYAKQLVLNNSTISKQNASSYYIDELYLIDSQIISEEDCLFYTNNIYLENSSITSETNLFYPTLTKIQFNDNNSKEKSYIEAGNSIKLLNRNYMNHDNKVITLEQENIEHLLSISNLISIYKTIYKNIEDKTKEETITKEQIILSNIDEEEQEKIINIKQEYEEKRKKIKEETKEKLNQKLKLKIKEKY